MNRAERALLFAAFSAALGFGTLIPVLPVYLAAAGAPSPWHAGALPSVFLVVASLSAPLWGRFSDRIPRRRVLLCGLAGAVLAVVPFFLQHSVTTLYVYQAGAGLAFGAVGPVALAMLYEAAPSGSQARGVAWFNSATLAGYFVGPAAGGWTASLAGDVSAHRVVQVALAVHALLAITALLFVATARYCAAPPAEHPDTASSSRSTRALLPLSIALFAAFMIGAFEIDASLFARSPLHLGPADVASVFMACSAAMLVVQLAILPRLAARGPRLPIALGCVAASAVLLALMAMAQAHAGLIVQGALQGAVLGLAVGLVSFETAMRGGAIRGRMLGYQNAAMNAGQALGSAAGATAFITLGAVGLPMVGALVLLSGTLLAIRGRKSLEAHRTTRHQS